MGRSQDLKVTYLTPKEENELAEFLVKACKMGNSKTKREVIQGVKGLVEKKRGKEGFKFNGEGWWFKIYKETSRIVITISRSTFILSI